MTPDEQLIKELERIAEIYKANILKAIQTGATKEELALLIAQSDFYQQLEPGLIPALDKFFNDYDLQIQELYKYADKLKVNKSLQINRNLIEAIKEVNLRDILGKARDYSNQVQKEILLGIVNNKTIPEITKDLDAQTNLTNNQMNTAVSTGFRDYGRALTNIAFDEAEQKFLYYGSTIPTSSKQCTWLIMNQNMKGYTKAEINKGISTPFGMINWNGRIPNYNCDEKWLPLTDTLLSAVKELQANSQGLAAMILQGR